MPPRRGKPGIALNANGPALERRANREELAVLNRNLNTTPPMSYQRLIERRQVVADVLDSGLFPLDPLEEELAELDREIDHLERLERDVEIDRLFREFDVAGAAYQPEHQPLPEVSHVA